MTTEPVSAPLVGPGDRLPDLGLTGATPDVVAAARRPRTARVAVLVHSTTCDQCLAFLERLQSVATELREWDALVFVVTPGVEASSREVEERCRGWIHIAPDPERRWIARVGIDGPGVLVADQWDELSLVSPAGASHSFIEAAEIVDWARFLAIQCPECQGEAL